MNRKSVVALYLRISDEDEELNTLGESESISGQRLLLTKFVESRAEFANSTVIEIVDDGYSGTNFERPGIKQLLEMTKAHQVDCIVVNDFSRFGRNYLEVGNYLEQVFPFLGIRFLSVGDCFDSFQNQGAAGSIEVGFKTIISEAYSKDLSQKIKTIRRSKAEQGKFVTAFAPFGYQKSKEKKGQLIVDEECARIVRRIFDLFLDGKGKTEIARLLNREQIPSPLMIRRQRNENFDRPVCKEQSHWTASTVSHILSDQRYVGDAVYGKVTPVAVGRKKDAAVPREDWIIVPDMHPRLIERDQFELVQAQKKTHNYKRSTEGKPLAKKVICRACNHALKRICKGGQVYFQCTTHRNTDLYPCFTGQIPEPPLETAILAALSSMTVTIQEEEVEIREFKESASVTIFKNLQNTENAITRKKSDALALYEAFKAGRMQESVFPKRMSALEADIRQLCEQEEQYEKDYKEALKEQPAIVVSDRERIQQYAPYDCMSKKIVDEFVEAVYVETDGTISIKWSFSDPFRQDMSQIL